MTRRSSEALRAHSTASAPQQQDGTADAHVTQQHQQHHPHQHHHHHHHHQHSQHNQSSSSASSSSPSASTASSRPRPTSTSERHDPNLATAISSSGIEKCDSPDDTSSIEGSTQSLAESAAAPTAIDLQCVLKDLDEYEFAVGVSEDRNRRCRRTME
ncbi:hypothetical protein BGZ68_004302, partial [Mortierella alpina]